ncbi:MAG: ferrochelatase [Halioglobus sp.]
MKYTNTDNFDHDQPARIGVLITNLGTPQAPERGPVRRYLKEFLSDPRVIELPRMLWWFILNVVILTIRPSRSAAAYRSVWTEGGSPLLLHTRAQAEGLQESLEALYPGKIDVQFAMRYGKPSIAEVLQNMLDNGVRKLLVLPLYPQYSATTTASTFDAIAQDFTQRRWLPEFRFVTHYHDNPDYIAALAYSVIEHRKQHGAADKLVFSYHGIPKKCLESGDPYHCECLKTTRLVAETLGLTEDDYITTFQSRVGAQEWLQPYTDETMKALPAKGVKSVQVICPGFSSDCLETIEEIDIENREYFEGAGGERYEYIPCLNSSTAHIECLTGIVSKQAADWLS